MENQKHTPEPWTLQLDGLGAAYFNAAIEAGNESINDPAHDSTVFRCDTAYSGIDPDTMEANTARIVACVNACAGIENPEAIADALFALRRISRFNPTITRHPAELANIARAALDALLGKDGG